MDFRSLTLIEPDKNQRFFWLYRIVQPVPINQYKLLSV